MKVFVNRIYIDHVETTTKEGKDFIKPPFLEVGYHALINGIYLAGSHTMHYEGIIDIPMIESNILQSLKEGI